MKTKQWISLSLMVLFVGCASKLNVIGVDDGQYEIIERHQVEQRSVDRARTNANRFCKRKNKIAKIANEDTQYEGQLDEETAKAIQKAGAIAGVLGAGKGEDSAAIATSDSTYVTKLRFLCQ